MSLLAPLLAKCLARRNDLAVVDDRRSYTYAQILGGAMFLAEKIDSVSSAPHIGVLLPTSGAFPIALLAGWLARRTVIPFNYLLSPDELRYVIQDSEVDTIITVGPMLEHLQPGNAPSPIPDSIRLLKLEELDFQGLPPLRWPPLPADRDTAVILYTSGTSGRPKGVMLSHANLHSNVDAAIAHAQITAISSFLGVLPNFHSFGLTALTLIPLRAGAKIVYTARFVPKRIVELIRKHRPDILMFIPSMYGALLSVKDASPDDFSSIHLAISGGEPLPASTSDEFARRFNVRLLEGYGLTETSPAMTWSTATMNRPRSVGRPIPGVEILIVDEADRPLPPNSDGEILTTGPNIMKGYFKLPDLTAQTFVDLDLAPSPDGQPQRRRFFRTGDIGKLDPDGYLYITGRKKEMLKVGGEIVFPREVEEVLNKHPSVHASAVIGKPDDLRGETPFAFVELNEGHPFDETALRSWCRDNLAGYKVPRDIRHIEKLPRNPTGKILRRQLKPD